MNGAAELLNLAFSALLYDDDIDFIRVPDYIWDWDEGEAEEWIRRIMNNEVKLSYHEIDGEIVPILINN